MADDGQLFLELCGKYGHIIDTSDPEFDDFFDEAMKVFGLASEEELLQETEAEIIEEKKSESKVVVKDITTADVKMCPKCRKMPLSVKGLCMASQCRLSDRLGVKVEETKKA